MIGSPNAPWVGPHSERTARFGLAWKAAKTSCTVMSASEKAATAGARGMSVPTGGDRTRRAAGWLVFCEAFLDIPADLLVTSPDDNAAAQ